EIADRGFGIPADELESINQRLSKGGEVGPDTARHMGLFVVSRLAERHGLTVRLRPTFDTARNPGITASVHIPDVLLVSPLALSHTGPQPRLDDRTIEAIEAYAVEEPAEQVNAADPQRELPAPIVDVEPEDYDEYEDDQYEYASRRPQGSSRPVEARTDDTDHDRSESDQRYGADDHGSQDYGQQSYEPRPASRSDD